MRLTFPTKTPTTTHLSDRTNTLAKVFPEFSIFFTVNTFFSLAWPGADRLSSRILVEYDGTSEWGGVADYYREWNGIVFFYVRFFSPSIFHHGRGKF